jgi:hypothetical protein
MLPFSRRAQGATNISYERSCYSPCSEIRSHIYRHWIGIYDVLRHDRYSFVKRKRSRTKKNVSTHIRSHFQPECLPPAFTLLSCSVYSSTLKMVAICSSETSVDFQRTKRRYVSDDRTLHNHCCENFNFCTLHVFGHVSHTNFGEMLNSKEV